MINGGFVAPPPPTSSRNESFTFEISSRSRNGNSSLAKNRMENRRKLTANFLSLIELIGIKGMSKKERGKGEKYLKILYIIYQRLSIIYGR